MVDLTYQVTVTGWIRGCSCWDASPSSPAFSARGGWAATTPAETKEKLLALLEGARSATEETRSALAAVGAPAVDGGAEIAARFVESLEGARDAYGRAGVAVRELSTANEATFYDGLGVIFKNLNDEYARAGVDTAGLNSPALREAFGRAPACR